MTKAKATGKKEEKSTAVDAKIDLSNMPSSDDIRQLALAMTELSVSLHEFVSYFERNPEIKQIPESLKELTKRISVLSTRL